MIFHAGWYLQMLLICSTIAFISVTNFDVNSLSSPLLSIEMLTFVGCEGLNTLPVSPGNTPRDSSYNKYNSLDRRRLSKLSPALLQPRDQPGSGGFMRLSAYVPNSEPKLRPYR